MHQYRRQLQRPQGVDRPDGQSAYEQEQGWGVPRRFAELVVILLGSVLDKLEVLLKRHVGFVVLTGTLVLLSDGLNMS